MGFHSAFEAKDADFVSSVTVRSPETEPSCLAGQISSYSLKVVDQCLVESDSDKTTNMEVGLLDLNRTPDDELVSQPEPHFCFLQDLNCPYVEETETSCEKSGVEDDTTLLCSPKCQNLLKKPVLSLQLHILLVAPLNTTCQEEIPLLEQRILLAVPGLL
ncbi:hypothetical protein Bca52824_095245 [Brassica carinata]|uniref:Uncharacterized protein n=1 Tax=Brassica carinata TaxID=52824 RepID=A0A8X7P235_BRACI|nr:hypothetical protein Bca52824_095245 [Brassica carinata]